jgi:hypothetical protein
VKLLLLFFPFLARWCWTSLARRLSRKELPPLLVTDNFMRLRSATVHAIRRVRSREDIQAAVVYARERSLTVSLMGAGHCSDGQQFREQTVLLDLRGLNRVLAVDEEAGVATVEAGVTWEGLVEHLRARQSRWGIHLKQTLLNKATIGGSVAVNIHGRKISSPPLIRYVRSLSLVDASGTLRVCSRERDHELFRLVIGGYGAFGVVYSVELDLRRVANLVRDAIQRVAIEEVVDIYLGKSEEGYLYGDFHSNGTGIVEGWAWMTMYRETDKFREILPFVNSKMSRFLYAFGMYLLHRDPYLPWQLWKREMERRDFNTTDGCQFTSIGEYYEDIHDGVLGLPGRDMHLEFQVDPSCWRELIPELREVVRPLRRDCVFCDLRFVKRDLESFLPYAVRDFFTLSPTFHLDEGNEREVRAAQERIYDLVVERYDGRFYLWDYFLGRPEHFQRAYPGFRQWLGKKREYDPENRFSSQWIEKVEGFFASPPRSGPLSSSRR